MLPPKMGEGVSGLSVGSVHLGASVAVSARTCTALLLRDRVVGLLTQLRADPLLTTCARDVAVREAMATMIASKG